MKRPLLLALSAALWCGISNAQQPQALTGAIPPTETSISPEDQKAFNEARQLLKLAQLWSKTLDWNETGSSTTDIVAHLRKALADEAPVIEVRGKDTSRSTFVLKQAPLGPTLSAVADLANSAVWVFSDHLVWGPEATLSPAERSLVKEGRGGEWQNSSMAQKRVWDPNASMEKLGVSIVGNEVKARLAAKGVPVPATTATTPPAPAPAFREEMPLTYELTFGELNPAVQNVLQEMLGSRFGAYPSARAIPAAKVEPSAVVSFDDTLPYSIHLRLQNPKADAPAGRQELGRWYVPKPPSPPPLPQQPK